MVEIKSLSSASTFWMPPGGGVHFGESLNEALTREMLEETGLNVHVQKMIYVSEYLKDAWHAVEFYFLCKEISGKEKLGYDPELNESEQILKNLQWIGENELAELPVYPSFIRRDFKKLISGDRILLSVESQG